MSAYRGRDFVEKIPWPGTSIRNSKELVYIYARWIIFKHLKELFYLFCDGQVQSELTNIYALFLDVYFKFFFIFTKAYID